MKKTKEEKKAESEKMWDFFFSLWDSRELMDHFGNTFVVCFETGKRLYRDKYRGLSTVYSHILPKEKIKYPQYKFCEWNVKIVHPDAHTQFSEFPEKAPKQYAEYKKLLSLHEKGEL